MKYLESDLTNGEKANAITEVENGRTQKVVADEYVITPGLINYWIKNKDKYSKAAKAGKNNNTHIRTSFFLKLRHQCSKG